MLRPALALAALLAAPTAHAADLDLKITSDGIGPVSVTLHDVHAGALPSVDLPGPDGRSMRVDLTLADSTMEGDPSYDLAMVITKREPARRKRVHQEVYRPTLRFKANQSGSICTGGRRPIAGDDPVQYEEYINYRIEVLVRTESPTL